jgi:hypothetical protein
VKNGHIEKLRHIFEHIVAGQKLILDMKWKQSNADVVKVIDLSSKHILAHCPLFSQARVQLIGSHAAPQEFTPEHVPDEQWRQNTRISAKKRNNHETNKPTSDNDEFELGEFK